MVDIGVEKFDQAGWEPFDVGIRWRRRRRLDSRHTWGIGERRGEGELVETDCGGDASELEGRFNEPDGFAARERGLGAYANLCRWQMGTGDQGAPDQFLINVQHLRSIGITEHDEASREPFRLWIAWRRGRRLKLLQKPGVGKRRGEGELVEPGRDSDALIAQCPGHRAGWIGVAFDRDAGGGQRRGSDDGVDGEFLVQFEHLPGIGILAVDCRRLRRVAAGADGKLGDFAALSEGSGAGLGID